jgi:hypothetical protein
MLCALRSYYWRFAPIINSFFGPQMCTMSQKFRKPGKFEGTEMSGNIESADTVIVTE